ncbi:MAG: TonB family protein [Myxococcales bacterium]|nr:TonB family protein [Myxococcales bacterium]
MVLFWLPGAGWAGETPPAPPPGVTVTPPEVQESVNAEYPQGALAAHQEANVLLLATVDVDGRVTAAEVLQSGGPTFDQSAIEALRKWRFKPALRGGKPFVSRVRVPFRFVVAGHAHDHDAPAPPLVPPVPDHHIAAALPSPEPPEQVEPPSDGEPPPSARFQSTARGAKAARGPSDFVLDRQVLSAAPHQSAGDLLASAPGVYIARPEGDAVAHQVYLRGFDAEHGQDIEFSVGPVPVNQPAHIHGQGYADLNLIIPEVVRSLRVTEGVYDPRQGDFAVAGSVEFDLGVADRGSQSHTSYGSFNTLRQLALWAPHGQPEETFGAVSIRRSDGYGQNRGSLSGALIGQYAFGSGALRGVAHLAAYGGRASIAGVLRKDDIDAGRVGFHDSYPDPSANAQSAFSARTQASVSLDHRTPAGARTAFAAWLLATAFRGRQNYSGYTQRSRNNPEWVGRGDLIEQENQDLGIGGRASHRSRRYEPRPWLSGTFEAGFSFRYDLVDQAQNLLQAPQNETWDNRVDATIRAADLGLYLDADWRISRYLRLRGGVRADVLYYDVDDRLGNFTPSFMRQSHLVGFRRTAIGIAYGPRAVAEVDPVSWLGLSLSYGEGYRSPQPRQLEEGESAPFAKVRSFEGGARLKLLGERISLSLAGYATFLSSDLAFDPVEGRLERIGPTRRAGVAGHLVARPWPWALLSLSVTFVRATLDAPPTATAENPAPAFTPGQLLPYVPPVILRADLGLNRDLFPLRGHAVSGRIGAGFTLLSPRPLPYGQQAATVTLLDVSAGVRWWFLELGVEVFNALNSRYAAVEYSLVSDWGARSAPSLVPARHVAAGPPVTAMGTLGLHF